LEGRTAPAGFNRLVSRADPSLFSQTAGGSTLGNATTVSADGRYAVFASSAADLIPGQIDNNGAGNPQSNNGSDIFGSSELRVLSH
jgi:hypothetical protein